MKFNLFRKPAKVHIPEMPVIVPVVPSVPKIVPPDTDYKFVEPNTDRFLVPNDVKDIHTLFDYLVNRTMNKGADAVESAIGEMDSFIKNNEDLLDLRHIPGLVCTDGFYMIEKGTSEDKFRFVMIKLNSWINATQSPITKREEGAAFFINKMTKEAEEYVSHMSPQEIEDLIFNHILIYKASLHTRTIQWFGKSTQQRFSVPYFDFNEPFLPPNLESYAIRFNDNMPLSDDIIRALFKEIDNARNAFKGKRLFAILNNNVYFVSDDLGGHFMFKKDSLDEVISVRNTAPVDRTYIHYIEELEKIEDDIKNSKTIPYISKNFKIKFIGL